MPPAAMAENRALMAIFSAASSWHDIALRAADIPARKPSCAAASCHHSIDTGDFFHNARVGVLPSGLLMAQAPLFEPVGNVPHDHDAS